MANKKKSSVVEKVSIAVAITLLVGLAVYFVQYTKSEYRVVSEPNYTTNTPVTGEYASIKSVTTKWGSKQGSDKIYPSATIELDAGSSKSGALRTFFRTSPTISDDTGKVIGDSNTYQFVDGVFENGESSVTVECTQGLASEAEFLGYSAQTKFRWSIQISEGEGSSRSASDFNKLAHAPIDPIMAE